MPGHLLLLNCFVGELNFANFIFVIGNSQFPQSGVKSSINYTHSSPRLADFDILSQTKMLDSCTYLYNPYTELTHPWKDIYHFVRMSIRNLKMAS